ncbi:MAG: rod shape-determining protein MreD [Planctomycetota bacterium]
MNWLVAAVITWAFFGLELGLGEMLRIGEGDIGPSFIAVLMTFIALHAPAKSATWAALILGFLADLTWTIERSDGGVGYPLGATALGMVLGARLIIAARGSLRGDHPLTLIFMTTAAGFVTQIVITAIFSFRQLYGDAVIRSPTEQLGERLLSSLYSGLLLGLVLWLPLRFLVQPIMGFPADRSTRPR